MKIVWKGMAASIFVHILYFAGVILYGFYLTKTELPDIVDSYENSYYLQNEVAFGFVAHNSSYIFIGTFLLGTAISIFIIKGYQRLKTE